MSQADEKATPEMVPENNSPDLITESWSEKFLRLSRQKEWFDPNEWKNFFNGASFFITGSFSRLKQIEHTNLIVDCGGLVVSTFDSKVKYLLAGEFPDIAICYEAKRLGIFILEEFLFLKFVFYKALCLKEQKILNLLDRIRKSVYPDSPPGLPALNSVKFQKKIQKMVIDQEFVFLWELSILEKSDCLLLVNYFGGKVSDDISTFTDCIVVGDKPPEAQLPELGELSYASFIYEKDFLDIFSNPNFPIKKGITFIYSFPSLPQEVPFCVTGEFSRLSREDVIFLLRQRGWQEVSAPESPRVLIVGNNPDMATVDACNKGVELVFEAAFMAKYCTSLLSAHLSKAIEEHESKACNHYTSEKRTCA